MKKLIFLLCFLIFGLFFCQNVSAASSLQNSSGGDLVSNVLHFKAIPGDSHIMLTWSDQKDTGYFGVIIQRSEDNFVSTHDTGQNVYKGTESSYIDLGLTNGQLYYYTIFAYDSSGNYSSGAIAKAKPETPSLISPYQEGSKDYLDTNEGKPLVSSKKIEKIDFADFFYYLILDKKVLEIGLDGLNNLRVTNNSAVLIEIPSDIFSKPLNVITASTGEASYLMKLVAEKNKYQVVIPAPPTKGDYEVRFVAVFADKSISDLKTKLVVDPRGYVFCRGSSFLGLGNKMEMRINGAKISVYQKNNNEWKIWNSEEYFQKNPQVSNDSGEYAFYLPNGEYYLVVEKTGYKTVKTESFVVDNLILNKNIEIDLKVKPWVWLIVVLGVLLIATLSFRYFANRRKKG